MGTALAIFALTTIASSSSLVEAVCNNTKAICVADEFIDFYNINDGRFYLGEPESTSTRNDHMLIQYFQKGRLELNIVSGHIRKGDAGLDLVQHRIPFSPGLIPENGPAHLYFPETGQSISFAFKDFYLFHDGFSQFGPPISPEHDDGLSWSPSVQYFTKARLEYHPENVGTSDIVQIGNIGQELLQRSSRKAVKPPRNPLLYGIQAHTWLALQHREILRYVAETGVGWVKHLILWSEVESIEGQYNWVEFDAFVDAAEFNSLKMLVTIVDAPAWSRSESGPGRPDEPSKFQRFMGNVAKRYAGRIAAYEIWNEPNLARFWGFQVDPIEYVRLLQAGYRGVKDAAPDTLVLFAGLAQNGSGDPTLGIDDIDFLRAVYKYKDGIVRNSFDVMGNHSYGYRSPPHAEYDMWFGDDFGPFLSHPSFFFKRFTQLRAVMEEFDDGATSMWMTEFGWTTDNSHPDFPFGQWISEEQQARYVINALEMIEKEYGYVHAMFLFNLNFRTLGLPDTSEHGFSILDVGFVPRPVYQAIKNMDKVSTSPSRILNN